MRKRGPGGRREPTGDQGLRSMGSYLENDGLGGCESPQRPRGFQRDSEAELELGQAGGGTGTFRGGRRRLEVAKRDTAAKCCSQKFRREVGRGVSMGNLENDNPKEALNWRPEWGPWRAWLASQPQLQWLRMQTLGKTKRKKKKAAQILAVNFPGSVDTQEVGGMWV